MYKRKKFDSLFRCLMLLLLQERSRFMHGFIIQSQIKSLMPDDTEMSQLISAAMQQSNNGSLRTVTVNLKCCDDGERL